ncbi:MAG: M14 family metallopeptidase [Asticcacaulis sp.]
MRRTQRWMSGWLAGAVLAALAPEIAMAKPSKQKAPASPFGEHLLPPVLPWKGKSEALMVKAGDPWITPSETTGLTASPSYDETVAFARKMADASPLLRLEVFGRSPEGRELVALVASKDGETLDPAKPRLLIQAGIHPGEIDGKDAGFMLLRDIAFKGKAALLDRVNVVFVPIFSVDGHERNSPYSRPNQRGPVTQGWRHTAQNLNLNRDYAKAGAPEMQAMIGLINRFDPDLYLDLHVTDGLDYQHDITYVFEAWGGHESRSPEGGRWLDTVYRPAVDAALSAMGHKPAPYISPLDNSAPEKGLSVGPGAVRFSTGYGDARRLPTVLVETHSLKPYRQRVLGTYVLLEATLKAAAEQGTALRAARLADQAKRPSKVVLGWEEAKTPYATFRFGPVSRDSVVSPVTGTPVVRWTGKTLPSVDVPVFGSVPAAHAVVPEAYYVPAHKTEVIARLKAHGLKAETLTAPRTVSLQMGRFAQIAHDPKTREMEGQFPVSFSGLTWAEETVTFAPGSLVVPTDQPLGELAVLLLEPDSRDSFLAWGYFPEIQQRVEYMEAYAIAPMGEAMMKADPKLKAEFEAKLAADKAFADSPFARLQFFYERSPYYDRHFRRYPVGKVIAKSVSGQ